MATTTPVNYTSKTFTSIRADLMAYIKANYPDVVSDFSDSTISQLLLDLNAGVGGSLNTNLDKYFQETQLQYAQLAASIYSLARTWGLQIPPVRPAITLVDYTVNIPALGNKPDFSYAPQILIGSQVLSGNLVFENENIIDFSSQISSLGDINRAIIPQLDSNGIIQSYQVTKREVVTNKTTNIYRRTVTNSDIKPFLQITLPDTNIASVDAVILMPGTNFTTNPTAADFANPDYLYYQVQYLAQQYVFTPSNAGYSASGNTGLVAGTWIKVKNKFITEITDNGYTILTFGSSDPNYDTIFASFLGAGFTNQQFLNNYLQNTALGTQLTTNSTLFVQYSTSQGASGNVASGSITSTGNIQMIVNGSNQSYNQNVIRSLSVNNPINALGGLSEISLDTIKSLIRYNFSSQERDVTLNDYILQVFKLPGQYGAPFSVNAFKNNNKVIIAILGQNSDGTLNNSSNSLLKNNISQWLSYYRCINDYIEVSDGEIFNIAVQVDLLVDNTSNTTISTNAISTIQTFFDITTQTMNQDFFISNLHAQLSQSVGVLNVIDINIFAKVGGLYSMNISGQAFSNTSTGEIQLINNTLYSAQDSMFEIKFPSTDITVNLLRNIN